MPARTERDLTRGSIPRHILALAVPAILSTVVHNLYGLNDIFFSQFVGEDAQTAVSNNLFTLIATFGFVQLSAIGTLTFVARRTGARNEAGADHAARQGIVLSIVLSVATAAIGLASVRWIPALMGMSPAVTEESVRYLTVVFAGLPALFLGPTVESVFRARGDTRTPLFLQIVAVSTNIAGNMVAVLVLRWGVTGLALSTILSRLVHVTVGLSILRAGRVGIRLRRQAGPLLDRGLCRRIVRVSAPIAARTFLFGFIYQIVTGIASDFGTSVQNGLGVGIRIEGLCFFILVGFGLAASPMMGQNLGAGKPERAARGAWTALGMALGPALLFTAVFAIWPDELMDVLTRYPDTKRWGAEYLRIIAVCLPFLAMEVVFGQSFAGAGDTLPPMLIDVPLTAARIPLSLLLANGLGMGPEGIFWAIASTAIGRGVLMTLWFTRGRWKRARPDLD